MLTPPPPPAEVQRPPVLHRRLQGHDVLERLADRERAHVGQTGSRADRHRSGAHAQRRRRTGRCRPAMSDGLSQARL